MRDQSNAELMHGVDRPSATEALQHPWLQHTIPLANVPCIPATLDVAERAPHGVFPSHKQELNILVDDARQTVPVFWAFNFTTDRRAWLRSLLYSEDNGKLRLNVSKTPSALPKLEHLVESHHCWHSKLTTTTMDCHVLVPSFRERTQTVENSTPILAGINIGSSRLPVFTVNLVHHHWPQLILCPTSSALTPGHNFGFGAADSDCRPNTSFHWHVAYKWSNHENSIWFAPVIPSYDVEHHGVCYWSPAHSQAPHLADRGFYYYRTSQGSLQMKIRVLHPQEHWAWTAMQILTAMQYHALLASH